MSECCEKNNESCLHRITRFEDIYSGRQRAIAKLEEVSRAYGELVAIRYYYTNLAKPYFILAFYKSQTRGDYEVIYDSGSVEDEKYIPRLLETTSTDSEIGIEEIIISEYKNQGLIPKIGDFFRLNGSLYVNSGEEWINIGRGLETKDTSTVKLELSQDDVWNKIVLKASIPFSQNNFRITETEISIKHIDGGHA